VISFVAYFFVAAARHGLQVWQADSSFELNVSFLSEKIRRFTIILFYY
jgi:hypothetical protein